MDWQAIAIGALSLLSVLFGIVLRTIWDATQKLANDLVEIEKELPDKYVRRDDFATFREELMAVLMRIESKLDGKADK